MIAQWSSLRTVLRCGPDDAVPLTCTQVNDNAVLTTKDGAVIQVASADIYFDGGVMQSRKSIQVRNPRLASPEFAPG